MDQYNDAVQHPKTAFSDPAFAVHARYLLARTHHLAEERPEASGLYEALLGDYEQQVKAGRMSQKLHILEGLEQAPRGLQMLFQSENLGKLVVKVHDA